MMTEGADDAMLTTPLETLKKYVDQPSGSFDVEDVTAVAKMMAEDFASLGFTVKTIPGKQAGPILDCSIGSGDKQLMLMGHMDTVFPHSVYVPYKDNGDGTAMGSGIIDMKGGIMILLYALKEALPKIDLNRYTLRAILNPDEEIGSAESHNLILSTAKQSFAALSFEPSGPKPRLTCARKGVTSVLISCKGVPGHAGSQYKQCASAIQALCAQITKLYALRDDEHDISFNAGFITGGTAENVVASDAACRCEFRYFDQSYQQILMDKIVAICAQEPVPGVTTTVTFGASHPASDLTAASQVLLDKAQAIAKAQGRDMPHEKVGGAGDISIAAQAGIGVLDGLGMPGAKMHTVEEVAYIDLIPQQIELSAKLIEAVCE